MGSQRIVLTSPWRLGLFVFLLVVGCGFGLIYAYLKFFGGSLQFADPHGVIAFYGVAGGVALLGILGYMAVVSAAQPLEKVVAGGKRRQNLLKELAHVEDPRELGPSDYESDPDLGVIVERWRAHRVAGVEAEQTLTQNREALSSLLMQMREAAELGREVSVEGAQGATASFIATINRMLVEIGELRAAHGHAGNSVAVMRGAWSNVRERLHRHQQDVQRFAAAITTNSQQLNQARSEVVATTITASGAVRPIAAVPSAEDLLLDSNLGALCQRNHERVGGLRSQLELLAEQANALAIQAALQVSRMGEHGQQLLPLTEQIRGISTRFQKAAADLRVCEYDQESTATQLQGLVSRVAREWTRLANSTAGAAPAPSPQAAGLAEVSHLADSIAHAASGLDQLARALGADIVTLEEHLGLHGAPAATGEVDAPASRRPDSRRVAGAAAAELGAADSFSPASPAPAATAEVSPEEQLARIHQELFASGSAVDEHSTRAYRPIEFPDLPPQAEAAPPPAPHSTARVIRMEEPGTRSVRPAPPIQGEAAVRERVYDLSELGGVRVDDGPSAGGASVGERIWELSELGAVQV